MYEYILSTKLATFLVAVGLAVVVAGMAGGKGLWWRGLMFSFGPMLAVAFYVVAAFAPSAPDGFDLTSGLIFETTVLFIFFRLLRYLLLSLSQTNEADTYSFLKATFVLQVLFAFPFIGREGFGIFSEGSKGDYLYDGSLAKYFAYSGILVSILQAGFLGNRISQRGNPGWLGGAVALLNIALSIFSGSKGGSFLWILSTLAVVNYRRAQIPPHVKVVATAVACVALFATASSVADFLEISIEDFFELAVSRFFLNNDARALAFDLRTTSTGNISLLAESFRSVATLFGSPPLNAPLGVELFGGLFGEVTGNGANASLMGLLEYYVPAGYAAAPMLVALCGVLLTYAALVAVRTSMARASSRGAVTLFALFSITQLSQDFLAFQVVMPLVCLSIVALWIYDQNYKIRRRRRQKPALI